MKYLILLAILFAKGHGQQLGLIPPGRPVDRIPGPVGPEPIIDPQPPKSEPPRPATYLAIVPQNIRPNMELVLPVTLLQPGDSGMITALLLDDNNKTLGSDRIQARYGCDCTLTIQTPSDVSWGSYRVNITGSGGVGFENSTTLWGRPKSLSIFVQTDKAKYKPGDTVKYKVFAINSALNPVDVILDVGLYDPKGNKIDEQNGVSNLAGIEGELYLSKMPPLGSWKIEVKPVGYENADKSYYFDVEEYVLPKFEVTVTLPTFGRTDDEFLTGTVTAKYTFGKPVQGYLILTIQKPWGSGFHDPKAVRTEMLIDGEAQFNVPRALLEQLTRNKEYQTFKVTANVTESITGITLEGSSDIQYHKNPYKIEFHPQMAQNFKTVFGDPYMVEAKVTLQDGSPAVGITGPVLITATYFTDKPSKNKPANEFPGYELVSPFIDGEILMDKKPYPIAADGTVSFGLTIPDIAATATIKAEFRDQSVFKEISRFRSPTDKYLKATMSQMGPLKVGDTAFIDLKSNVKGAQGFYLVVSKNKVVESGSFNVNSAGIPIIVTREMAPSARIVAYFVQPDREIVADGLNFVVDEIYENKVTITFDQTENVRPKTNVNLKVTADRGSDVNVLVVDKSVRLLKTGNDITQERVENELSQYGDTPYFARGWGRIVPWTMRADDAWDVFNNAKLKVLTDAYLHNFNLWELNRPQPRLGSFSARGAMAMDSVEAAPRMAVGGGGGPPPTGQIRREFPETWIWESAVADGRGIADISAVVPDTITTWVASAYAMNRQTGLGVAPVPANLTSFLPFFVNLQLPYNVIRGETAVVQANVFNYHPEDLQVLVTLRGSPDFVGIGVDSNGQPFEITEKDFTRCVTVKSGKPTPVFFPIKPISVGPLQLNVRIHEQKERNIFDEVFRPLLVKAEGEEKEMDFSILISHKRRPGVMDPLMTERVIPIQYPPKTVPNSQKIRVTFFGDIFAPSLENLDELIVIPYGCGEQNMLKFAPAVFAAMYMQDTNRYIDNPDFKDKITRILRTGYVRELVYQRGDGSFSAFGSADDEGSLWLTAFVIKSFAQASNLNLILIDPNVVEKAVRFITRGHQTPAGNFVNTGEIHHKAMQGGTASSMRALTAYVLAALQEVKNSGIVKDVKTKALLDEAIVAATTYLDENIFLPMSDYEAAIGAYALKLVNSAMYTTFLHRLENSVNKTVEGGSMYWKNPSYALQIEIASYALMTFALKNEQDTGMKDLDWLVQRRGSRGGFSSTQDTVVALQALSEFAKLVYSKDVDMRINVFTTKGQTPSTKIERYINRENNDILQYVDFDGDVDSVTVEADGTGLVVVATHVFYNVEVAPEQPSYALSVRTFDESMEKFKLEACTRFLVPDRRSNMAILSIGAPSGFEVLEEGVAATPFVKRTEVSGGRLNIYFDEITAMTIMHCLTLLVTRDCPKSMIRQYHKHTLQTNPLHREEEAQAIYSNNTSLSMMHYLNKYIPDRDFCLTVRVQRLWIVSDLKDVMVKVYSYYEPGENALASYLPDILKTKSNICDVCGAECGCKPNPLMLKVNDCVANIVPGASRWSQ